MTGWVSERASVNAKVQVGAESTSSLGSSVSANKILQNYTWKFGVDADVSFLTPTGRKYPSLQTENKEWVEGTMDGPPDYNSIIYALASAMGSVSPAAHGASATAKDWIFTPTVTGSQVPQTYTIEQGDTIRAHKFSYGLLTQWGYKGDRSKIETSGKLIAQKLSDGITMTSNPTAVTLAPIIPKQVNIYLDTTSAGLGGTQLTRVLSYEYTFDNIYGPFWAVNRSLASWTAHVDLQPKCTFKLKVEADATGMGLLSTLQDGSTVFMQVDATGATIDTAITNTFKHQFAGKVGKPSTFEDDQGIFAIEWEITIVEDATWTKAQTITVTNLITAL